MVIIKGGILGVKKWVLQTMVEIEKGMDVGCN